jgi:hypothetical protein
VFGTHCHTVFLLALIHGAQKTCLQQLGSRQSARSPDLTTASSPKCDSVLCPEERNMHNATLAMSPLAQNQGANPVPLMCSSVPFVWTELLHHTWQMIFIWYCWRQQPLPKVYIIAGANRPSHSTLGDRAFPAAAAWAWNSLLLSAKIPPTLRIFCKLVETFLFTESFPNNPKNIWCTAPLQLSCDASLKSVQFINIIILALVLHFQGHCYHYNY